MTALSRRTVLGGMGLAGTTGLSGCLGFLGAEPHSETETPGKTPKSAEDRPPQTSPSPGEGAETDTQTAPRTFGPVSGEIGSNPSEELGDFSPAGDLAFEDVVVEVIESEVDHAGNFSSEWPTIDINATTEEFTATGTTYTRYLCHEWEITYMGFYDRRGYLTIKKTEDEPDSCESKVYVRHEIQIRGQFTGGVPEQLTVQFDEYFMNIDETSVEIN